MKAEERVLFIDDDINLLSAIRRQLHGKYDVITVPSGAKGLELLTKGMAPAVVICDMRMPGESGANVLETFSRRAANAARIMLTGNADQGAAAEAVNKGHVFRFLTKPCANDDLCNAIDAGLQHHRVLTAEKRLLETTLAGSIKLLSDVASLIDPATAGNARKVTAWATRLAPQIPGVGGWELNFAAMLAPLGRVAVPAELLVRKARGEALSAEEVGIFRNTPEVGSSLVAHIPRMENVARGILYQDKQFDGGGFPADDINGANIPLIGRVLHLLKAVVRLTGGHEPGPSVFDELERMTGCFDPDLLAVARRVLAVGADQASDDDRKSEYVPLFLLRPGHELVDNLEYENGGLVLATGTVLSAAQIARLRVLTKVHKVREPVQVLQPAA
ncbi:MAG: response regulator [Rhodospirillales bacterium]